MRARIYDPAGPWWWRLPLPLLAALLSLGGPRLMARGVLGPEECQCATSVLCALLLFFPLRFAERDAVLELRAGRVDVRGAGALSQPIVAKRVRAASTAVGGDGGGTVAFGRRYFSWGSLPIVLKVETSGDVERLCDALGVGNDGAGHCGGVELRWPVTVPSNNRRKVVDFCLIVIFLMFAFFAARALSSLTARPDTREPKATALGLLLLVPLVVGVVIKHTRDGGPAWVALGQGGLDVSRISRDYPFIPYYVIDEVVESPGAVDVKLAFSHGSYRIQFAGPSRPGAGVGAGVEAFAAQLRTAVRRAHDNRAREPGVDPSAEALFWHGVSVKAWLERLDAAAQTTRAGAAHGGAAASVRALCEALDGHDADPERRAAAARILVRVAPDEVRSRLDAAIAMMREPSGPRGGVGEGRGPFGRPSPSRRARLRARPCARRARREARCRAQGRDRSRPL